MKTSHEQAGLSAWTELCEICDWDEMIALQTIERFVQVKSPFPTGRIRELCQILSTSHAAIKSSILHNQTPEA